MKLSPHDPVLILDRLMRVEFLARINPFALSKAARVRSRWRQSDHQIRHWTQIPAVEQRINRRITGQPDLTFKDFVCRKYLNDGRPRTALSLGCGDGDRERDWARRGVFSRLRGLDLSPERIANARRAASEAGLAGLLSFDVADVNNLSPDEQRYDAVIFEHSLHHFTNIPAVLGKVRQLLQPGGLLIVDEFIGPRRFQWTRPQLAFADALLASLPGAYRRTSSGFRLKTRNLRAGELLMWLNDPSEAVESDRIEAEILRQFSVLHGAYYGGTISHLVFHDIAHHFAGDDPEARAWVERILDAEDSLLQIGLLASDFGCFVCSAPRDVERSPAPAQDD